ncbi:MAG: hypothetical protein K2I91_02205, partial [Muribaculaceae bacterium]|nr:hypothetical protein [Muribaculaceae bacterium]
DVENGKTYTLNANSQNNYDWRFPAAGDYTLTINWKDKTLAVATSGSTVDPDPTDEWANQDVYIRGNFNGSTDWGNGLNAKTDANGIASFTNVAITGEFKIVHKNGNNYDWYSTSEITPGSTWNQTWTSYDDNITIAGQSSGDKYNIDFNIKDKTLRVIKVIPQKTIYLRGKFKNGVNWDPGIAATTDASGVATWTDISLDYTGSDTGFKIYYDGNWCGYGGCSLNSWNSLNIGGGNNITVNGGSNSDVYTIEYNIETKKFRVTKTN